MKSSMILFYKDSAAAAKLAPQAAKKLDLSKCNDEVYTAMEARLVEETSYSTWYWYYDLFCTIVCFSVVAVFFYWMLKDTEVLENIENPYEYFAALSGLLDPLSEHVLEIVLSPEWFQSSVDATSWIGVEALMYVTTSSSGRLLYIFLMNDGEHKYILVLDQEFDIVRNFIVATSWFWGNP